MSGAAGSYKDLFCLSGWVSALLYAVSVIVPLYVCEKFKHKCNAQSNLWELRQNLQDL